MYISNALVSHRRLRFQFKLTARYHHNMAGFVCLKNSTKSKSFRAQTSVLCCSVLSNSAAPWTTARHAPPSMGFTRQEYWSGLPLPPPGDLPHPGIEPVSSLASPALAGGFQAFANYVGLISSGECVWDPMKWK